MAQNSVGPSATATELNGTLVDDITPLKGKDLELLWLYRTPVDDISALSEAVNLVELNLSRTEVSDAQVDELKERLPNCRLIGP